MKKKMLRLMARLSIAACLMASLCLSAFATEGSESGTVSDISGVTSALTNGLTALVPTILTAVGTLAVAGLAIFGAKFAVRAGLQMFRQVTGR